VLKDSCLSSDLVLQNILCMFQTTEPDIIPYFLINTNQLFRNPTWTKKLYFTEIKRYVIKRQMQLKSTWCKLIMLTDIAKTNIVIII